jgi:hypothetical protein
MNDHQRDQRRPDDKPEPLTQDALNQAIRITNAHRLHARRDRHWNNGERAAEKHYPLVPHHRSASVWIKEVQPIEVVEVQSFVPLAKIDSEVGSAERIRGFYSRGLVYPHIAVPQPCLDYIPTDLIGPGKSQEAQRDKGRFEHHPWVILRDIDIVGAEPYANVWGRNASGGKNAIDCDLPWGVGSIGWSYRQKRRFVRKLAMLRILFLFMRSKRLRGGGDKDPQMGMPLELMRMADTFDEQINGQTDGAHGPWDTVEAMVKAIWERENNWGYPKQDEGRKADIKKIAERLDSYTPGMRKAKDELDPDMPYVFEHGDLTHGFNLMMQHTNPVATIDFETAAYVPYSDAISDLSTQYPVTQADYHDRPEYRFTVRPRLGYSDWEEWVKQAEAEGGEQPFDAEASWQDVKAHMTNHKPRACKGDLRGKTWSDYHNLDMGSREPGQSRQPANDTIRQAVRFDFKDKKHLLARWGEITWEDFVSGDRFQDFDEHERMFADKAAAAMPFDHYLFDPTHPRQVLPRAKIQNDDDAKRVVPDRDTDQGLNVGWGINVVGEWFVPPVMFLVTSFVEKYLNKDPRVKWEDPFFHISSSAGWHWLA